jgi:tRNA threonylcarbamoyl adenosine modification protein YeaZ
VSGATGAPGVTGAARTARLILALDTATSRVVIALGDVAGSVLFEDGWTAGHRHGETLLPRLQELLSQAGVRIVDVSAIVVGTGPGTFTGLRVGLATAKALAVSLDCPIVGIATAAALLDADRAARASSAGASSPGADDDRPAPAADDDRPAPAAVLVPAGPNDRVLIRAGAATLVPAGSEPDLDPGQDLVAVDLDGRAAAEASARGHAALGGLAGALLRIGAARVASGDVDDVRTLVPEYVTLPRGIREEHGTVEWSHSPA